MFRNTPQDHRLCGSLRLHHFSEIDHNLLLLLEKPQKHVSYQQVAGFSFIESAQNKIFLIFPLLSFVVNIVEMA